MGCLAPAAPPPPGKRHEFEVGGQQSLGRWLVADVGYFDKRTDNGYDFGVLFDTPIAFPISWDHSHVYGLTGRLTLLEHRGFSAFFVAAHDQRHLLAAGYRRPAAGTAAGRLPHRPRPEVQRHDAGAVRVQQGARRVGRALLAVRLRSGSRSGRQPRGCARAHRRSAGGDRVLLRDPVRDPRQPAHERGLHREQLRGDSSAHPG